MFPHSPKGYMSLPVESVYSVEVDGRSCPAPCIQGVQCSPWHVAEWIFTGPVSKVLSLLLVRVGAGFKIRRILIQGLFRLSCLSPLFPDNLFWICRVPPPNSHLIPTDGPILHGRVQLSFHPGKASLVCGTRRGREDVHQSKHAAPVQLLQREGATVLSSC